MEKQGRKLSAVSNRAREKAAAENSVIRKEETTLYLFSRNLVGGALLDIGIYALSFSWYGEG